MPVVSVRARCTQGVSISTVCSEYYGNLISLPFSSPARPPVRRRSAPLKRSRLLARPIPAPGPYTYCCYGRPKSALSTSDTPERQHINPSHYIPTRLMRCAIFLRISNCVIEDNSLIRSRLLGSRPGDV